MSKVLPIVTPALLASLRNSTRLPAQSWYFIAGVTLSVLNRPEEVGSVLKYALEHGSGPGPARSAETEKHNTTHASPRLNGSEHELLAQNEPLYIARRMREGLVKSTAVVGLPKTINALTALQHATPTHLLDPPLTPGPTARLTAIHAAPDPILARGAAFFAQTYGKVTARVQGNLDAVGTADLGVLARLLYGHVLSNVRVLGAGATSCVLLAALVPQEVGPQLKGHVRGASAGNGLTEGEVEAVLGAVRGLVERDREGREKARVSL